MLLRVLLAGLAVVIIGAGLGISAYALREVAGQRDTVVLVNSTATLIPTLHPQPTTPPAPVPPTPVPTGALGSTIRMPANSSYGYSLIWVNRTGLWAWMRAYEERDQKGQSRVMDLYETLRVPNGTLVRVVAIDGDATQVEILEGALIGRRGWQITAGLR